MARRPEIVNAAPPLNSSRAPKSAGFVANDPTTLTRFGVADASIERAYNRSPQKAVFLDRDGYQRAGMRHSVVRETDDCCATIEKVVAAASTFATYVDQFRSLPLSISLCRNELTPPELCFAALRVIHVLATKTPYQCPDLRKTYQVRPDTYYPEFAYSEDLSYPRTRSYYTTHFVVPLLQWVASSGFFPAVVYSPPLFGKAISAVASAPSATTPVPLRFAEAAYLICHILRHYHFFDELPPFVVPAVASPRGLFPWSPPKGKEPYLSALAQHGPETMFAYPEPCNRADIYLMAKAIIGNSTNPFLAAKAVFEFGPWMVPGRPATYKQQQGTLMCRGSDFSFPYCVPSGPGTPIPPTFPGAPSQSVDVKYSSAPYSMTTFQFGDFFDTAGLGVDRFPLGTSQFPLYSDPPYFRAIGVPAVLGAVYFDLSARFLPQTPQLGHGARVDVDSKLSHGGWVSVDPHVPFGASLVHPGVSVGWFEPGQPPPAPGQNVVTKSHWATERINSISENFTKRPVGPSALSANFLFCNFSDVLTYGPRTIVDVAQAAGIKVIVCHVKSVLGWLHCKTATDAGKLLGGQDPLALLIGEANKTRSRIEVWAGVSMFADYRKRKVDNLPSIYRWKSQGDFAMDKINKSQVPGNTDYWVSPGSTKYTSYMKAVIAEIAKNYEIAGVVLTNAWVPRGPNAVGNNLLPASAPENVDFDSSWGFSRLGSTTTLEDVYSKASDLISKAIFDSFRDLYGLGKAVCSWPLGTLANGLLAPHWPQGETTDWWSVVSSKELSDHAAFFGYLHVPNLSRSVDYVIYSVNGNWLMESQPYWQRVLGSHNTFGPQNAVLSFQMLDEWMYPPKFWSGLSSLVRLSGGSGIALHTPASCLGEYGPAFSRSALATLGAATL
ncbi:MAG: hypothetical protein HUU55_23295 [Myxococcales bacterium]|nr:hypothetical protein [Myxococcales bacterium]